jgi:hypothetical protein
MKNTIVTNKSLLLKNDDTIKHTISIDPDDESLVVEVWVRDISFLDIQNAAQKMIRVEKGDVTLDLAGYWGYALSNWITKTNPNLSNKELLSLKGYVGEQICKVLPQPTEMMEALQGGFTKQTE